MVHKKTQDVLGSFRTQKIFNQLNVVVTHLTSL